MRRFLQCLQIKIVIICVISSFFLTWLLAGYPRVFLNLLKSFTERPLSFRMLSLKIPVKEHGILVTMV